MTPHRLLAIAGLAAALPAPKVPAQTPTSAAAPVVARIRNPLDSLPPSRYFGVTEAELARVKLERLVRPGGFPVLLVTDMEGLAGVTSNGREMSDGPRGFSADHQHFRQELTDEVNAAIAGARSAGATQFFVVEGHGANNFRNILVERVDPEAMLLRGWPRPNVMETGVNAGIRLMMVVGNHPNAGSHGIIAHSYAFSRFTVNGTPLNESGISAFIGGEYGVPLGMVSGDDSYIAEMKALFGPALETVTSKLALSGSGGAMFPLAQVHAGIRDAAARAVRKARAGELKPLTFEKPYRIAYCLRASFRGAVLDAMSHPEGFDVRPDPEAGDRCFTWQTGTAQSVATLLNVIEWAALKP